MLDAWEIMDAWCKERAAKTGKQATDMHKSGVSLTSVKLRAIVAEHNTYNKMRSFIHGARNA